MKTGATRRAGLLAVALCLSGPVIGAAARAAAPAEDVHVVEAGETLGGIAHRAKVSAAAIAEANDLAEPYVVRVGQRLTIPRTAIAAHRPPVRPHDISKADTAAPSGSQVDALVVARTADTSARRAATTAARVIEARAPSIPDTGAQAETAHKVLAGETLSGIALRARVPRVLIIEANALKPPFNVRTGQVLQIPRTRHHSVKNNDSAFSISLDYAVPWQQIAVANNLDPDAPLKTGQNLLIPTLLDPAAEGMGKPLALPVTAPGDTPMAKPPSVSARPARFAWPVTGILRRGYATGTTFHDGLDIGAPKGTMVRAAAAGTVAFAGKEADQFGNLVVLNHGDGWFTAYGFLSRVTVKPGARVAAGERIGLVGDTGLAKGEELHFEVRRDGKPVDPLPELPKAP